MRPMNQPAFLNFEDRERKYVAAIIAASLVLGVFYMLLARPGLPYDEPSHFRVVQYYAEHVFAGKLPILGQPDIDYEAYQPPVYYTLSAFVYRIASFGGEQFAFFVLRALSTLLLIPIVLLTYLIAQQAAPRHGTLVVAATVFIAFNPSLLAIVSSVQNDALALLLCLLVTYLTLRWFDGESTTTEPNDRLFLQRFLILGVLTGFAVLTKLSAAFLIAAIPVFVCLVTRRKRSPGQILMGAVVFLSVIAIIVGWWMARNYNVYGDLTGAKGLRSAYPQIISPRLELGQPLDIYGWVRELVTYYWLPVEYYRNLVRSPFWLDTVIVGGLMVVSAIGWLKLALSRDSVSSQSHAPNRARLLLAIEYLLCVGIWAWICITEWRISARSTLPTFFIFALLFGAGGIFAFRSLESDTRSDDTDVESNFFLKMLAVALLVANFYILWNIPSIPIQAFHLFV